MGIQITLTQKASSKICSRWHSNLYFISSEKISLVISCESSANEMSRERKKEWKKERKEESLLLHKPYIWASNIKRPFFRLNNFLYLRVIVLILVNIVLHYQSLMRACECPLVSQRGVIFTNTSAITFLIYAQRHGSESFIDPQCIIDRMSTTKTRD